MIIKATFTGTNSLGYENGKEYELMVLYGGTISRLDGSGECPYNSLHAFLKNWDNIKQISK